MCNFLFDTIQDKVSVQKETERNELKRTRVSRRSLKYVLC